MTTAVVAVVAAAVTGGAVHALDTAAVASAGTGSGAGTSRYRDVPVEAGPLTSTVTTTGTFAPEQRADLGFTSAGTVTSVPVAVGQQVQAGQVLAALDPTTLQAQSDSAQAAVTADESTVDSDSTSDDTSGSASGSAVSAQQLAAARAQLAAAQATLTQALTALHGATLTAPFAGTVAAVGFTVGQSTGSSGGSGSSGAAPVVTVVGNGGWLVDADVPSSSLGQLHAGQGATVVATGSTTSSPATVTSVGVVADPSTAGSSGGAQFPVVLQLTGNPAGVFTGAGADVTVTTGSTPSVLTVPTAALSTTGTRTTVQRVVAGHPVTTTVTLGAVDGSRTQVTSGLSTGDTVRVTVPDVARLSTTSGGSGGFGGFGGTGGSGGGRSRSGGSGGSGGSGAAGGHGSEAGR